MRAAQRTCVAVAACWCIALCMPVRLRRSCRGDGRRTRLQSVGDASQIPTGETIDPLPTGWERFEPKNIGQTIEVWTGRGPNETIAHQLYAQADELYRKKNYHDAALKYEAAADRFPGTTLEEDATCSWPAKPISSPTNTRKPTIATAPWSRNSRTRDS